MEIDVTTGVRENRLLPTEPVCANLSEVLALVEPGIGASLLDPPARLALHRIAKQISSRLSPFWGLEVRLGDPAPRADILWEVAQGNGGVPTLAGRQPHDLRPELTGALRRRSPFWRELARFAEEWLDKPEWRRRLGNIWLEVDAASEDLSIEALEAHLDRPNLFWGPVHRVAGSDRDLLLHLAALGQRFFGLEADRERIRAVADSLPPGGYIFQMGVMGARASPVTRLCVKNLGVAAMERWLAAIAWPGDRARLHRMLARLAPLCGELALNVDILQDRVAPKLGLEIYCGKRTLTMDGWRPVCDELRASGLVRADKLAALAEFPSYRQYRQYGAWKRIPPIGSPAMATNLHHLKLVLAEDAPIEAKAYLGIYRPVMNYSLDSKDDIEDQSGWL